MHVTLVNPELVVLRADPLTTGIPYLPILLASAAATVRDAGHPVDVIDAFGEAPNQCRHLGRYVLRGLTPEQGAQRLAPTTELVVVYAMSLAHHVALIATLRALRRARPDVPIVVMENTQAVTAYALRPLWREFVAEGATYVLCGDPERRLLRLIDRVGRLMSPADLDGVGWADAAGDHFSQPTADTTDLNTLPFPAWELFPLQAYWSLGYAHGPLVQRRYLPLLTSRGCPFHCRFCVIPGTNAGRWRSRSPAHVVAEMAHWQRTLQVSEFHFEDVNPTVDDARIRALCRQILARRLAVTWKIVAGTKVETIRSTRTVAMMARAGCRYLSISPESGSAALRARMGKTFDLPHALTILAAGRRYGLRSQCCFVIGFPGETDEDRACTWRLVHQLARHGVDEIAVFVATPVPGSAIFEHFAGYEEYSQLNFSPTWRGDFAALQRFRWTLYLAFAGWALWYHPVRLVGHLVHLGRRRFHTKMEMAMYRGAHTAWLALWAHGRRGSEALAA